MHFLNPFLFRSTLVRLVLCGFFALQAACTQAPSNTEVYRFAQPNLPTLEASPLSSIGAEGSSAQWINPRVAVGAHSEISIAAGFSGTLQWPTGETISSRSASASAFVGMLGGWVRQLTSANAVQILDLETSAAGDLWVLAQFEGTVALGSLRWSAPSAGRPALLILKWSASGAVLWSRTLDAKNLSQARLQINAEGDAAFTANLAGYSPVAPDPQLPAPEASVTLGKFILTAVGDQDALVAKLSPQGEWIWAKRFGAHTQGTSAVQGAVLDNGDVVVIGEGEYWIDLLPVGIALNGAGSAYIARLSARTGETRWISSLERFVLRGPAPLAARGREIVIVGDAIGNAGMRALWPQASDRQRLVDSSLAAQASLLWLDSENGRSVRVDALPEMRTPDASSSTWLSDVRVLLTEPGQVGILLSRWMPERPRSDRYLHNQMMSEVGGLRQSLTSSGWNHAELGGVADAVAWDAAEKSYVRVRALAATEAGVPNETPGAWLGIERLRKR